MSSVKARVAVLVLPARSVPVTETVCAPSAGERREAPDAGSVGGDRSGQDAVDGHLHGRVRIAGPVTVATFVIPSVADVPVSETSATVTGGGVVSRVNASDAFPVLPARSVSLTTTVWLPSARTGVKLQRPSRVAGGDLNRGRAVDAGEHRGVGIAGTAIVSLLVTLSVADAPLSTASASVTAGATVSTVKCQARLPDVAGEIRAAGHVNGMRCRPRRPASRLQRPVVGSVATDTAAPPSMLTSTEEFGSPIPDRCRVGGDPVGRERAGVGYQLAPSSAVGSCRG